MKLAKVIAEGDVSMILPSPRELHARFPMGRPATGVVEHARSTITNILAGTDPRLLAVVGPCSIHEPAAALDYARWLREIATRYEGRLFLVMRAYVEKARTGLGWKGLIQDPRLDGSDRIDEGLAQARALLAAINDTGVPVATEMIGPATPAYLADTVSWAAIGARTVESQVHRELASGLECPVGFKNTTGGDVAAAVYAVLTARQPHTHVSIDADGRAAIVTTRGNAAAHVILRGGPRPNYDALSIANASAALESWALPARLVVDCSHGNSGGDYRQQASVARSLAAQMTSGSRAIAGVMIESYLKEGRQVLGGATPLCAGQSVTDACLGPEATLEALDRLADCCVP